MYDRFESDWIAKDEIAKSLQNLIKYSTSKGELIANYKKYNEEKTLQHQKQKDLLEQKQKEMDKIDAENKIKIKKFNKEIDDEIEMFKTLTQWRKDDSTRKKNTLFNKQIQITYIRITEKINEISKLFIEILEIIKENYKLNLYLDLETTNENKIKENKEKIITNRNEIQNQISNIRGLLNSIKAKGKKLNDYFKYINTNLTKYIDTQAGGTIKYYRFISYYKFNFIN